MIASLTGIVRQLSSDRLVVDVNGIGFLVHIHARTSQTLVMGAHVTIQTSLIVREDAMTVYGFHDIEERDLFELLQTVTGIGPKVALAITSSLTGQQLASAIASDNVALIEKVPGIGRKGAQRLILELKGKVSSVRISEVHMHADPMRDQLFCALTGLGYSSKEADNAVSFALAQAAESSENVSQIPLSDLLKIALQGRK